MNGGATSALAPSAEPARPWWKGAVIYQIYPRSFADSNGDGVGDLPGITARLDHVASLGVDAIWISPFFTSPMRDFGYDVADFRGVDPVFGTLADFDALAARAHALGLKLVIDQVWSHCSDQHPWFVESRQDRTNPKADWFTWADPKPDGSPPNNWQSVFGGPAWTWDARRRQYYLHNFLPEQPDLNFHAPAVQEAILDVARFWLERGVDGFRLDAINFLMCDPALTDNPPAPDNGAPRTRSYDYQLHIHNQSQPEVVDFLERVRALTDSLGGRFTVAEIGGLDGLGEMQSFTRGDRRLNSAYGFDFLYADRLTPELVKGAVAQWPDDGVTGWPSWTFSNHDAPRALSRWASGSDLPGCQRMMTLLLMCLRGNVFLYQGEELGLTQVEVPFDRLRDPEAIRNWPLTLSRDGARTPMPWSADAPHAGFSRVEPWLPIGADHHALAVDRQAADPASLLAFTRAAIALRQGHEALRTGRIKLLDATEGMLAFEREDKDERLLCVFNLGEAAARWSSSEGWTLLLRSREETDDPWALPPASGLVASRAA